MGKYLSTFFKQQTTTNPIFDHFSKSSASSMSMGVGTCSTKISKCIMGVRLQGKYGGRSAGFRWFLIKNDCLLPENSEKLSSFLNRGGKSSVFLLLKFFFKLATAFI